MTRMETTTHRMGGMSKFFRACLALLVVGCASTAFAQTITLPFKDAAGVTHQQQYNSADAGATIAPIVSATVSASIATTATASNPIYVEGSTTNPISVDLSGGMRVTCITGCAGGTSSNASDAVATSSNQGRTLGFNYGFNGTTWDRLQVDASKQLKVVLPSGFATAAKQPALGTAGSASNDVLTVQGIVSMTPFLSAQSGTWTVQPGNTANTTAWKVDNSAVTQPVAGVTASAASLTANPLTVGCRAATTVPTAVADGQVVNAQCGVGGALVVRPYAISESLVSGTTSAMTGTTSTLLVAAPASGLRNYITTLVCVNSHATVGTFITVQDGSGGTALMTLAGAAVFGGAVVPLPAPLRQPTTATGLYVADVTTGANVICSAFGYTGP